MKKDRILIYAHYYAPDVASTGQILQDLAEGMRDDFNVTVICTVPSYTGNIEDRYLKKRYYKEKINGVRVVRVRVPEFNKASKFSRIKNLLIYLVNAMKVSKYVGAQDYILTISQPPILGGLLGVYGKKRIKNSESSTPKLIYCIQDFNPEQIMATGYIKSRFLLGIAQKLDMITCKKADLIITVGRDLVETLKGRFERSKTPRYAMINNWIDDEVIYPLDSNDQGVLSFKKKYGLTNQFIFMYSGNIGLYYDLEGIIKVLSEFKNASTSDGRKVSFVFVGEGSLLNDLKEYKERHNLDNVIFIPYQDKEGLIYSLNAADVHWCINAKGIKGVSCPSKFYGILGVGKPVLGVLEKNSEVEMLINEISCGIVSEPKDYKSIKNNIRWFIDNSQSTEIQDMGKRGRKYLKENLTKEKSINKYISTIKGL